MNYAGLIIQAAIPSLRKLYIIHNNKEIAPCAAPVSAPSLSSSQRPLSWSPGFPQTSYFNNTYKASGWPLALIEFTTFLLELQIILLSTILFLGYIRYRKSSEVSVEMLRSAQVDN